MRLAERFGCTLEELGARLSATEYQLWRARDSLKQEDFEARELTLEEEIAQMERVLN